VVKSANPSANQSALPRSASLCPTPPPATTDAGCADSTAPAPTAASTQRRPLSPAPFQRSDEGAPAQKRNSAGACDVGASAGEEHRALRPVHAAATGPTAPNQHEHAEPRRLLPDSATDVPPAL
jgi:hypothetical protein